MILVLIETVLISIPINHGPGNHRPIRPISRGIVLGDPDMEHMKHNSIINDRGEHWDVCRAVGGGKFID